MYSLVKLALKCWSTVRIERNVALKSEISGGFPLLASYQGAEAKFLGHRFSLLIIQSKTKFYALKVVFESP